MKLVTWNNGGLSSFGEGYKSRLIADHELPETLADATEDLQDKLGRDHSLKINVFDVVPSHTVEVEKV